MTDSEMGYESRDRAQSVLLEQSDKLKAEGDLDGALDRLKELEHLQRRFGPRRSLALSLSMQVDIMQQLGQLDNVLPILREVEQIGRDLDIDGYVEGSLKGRAI